MPSEYARHIDMNTEKPNSRLDNVRGIKHKDEVDRCPNRSRCVALCGGEDNFCTVRDLTKIESVYHPDEAIYTQDDPVTALYIIQSGAVKTEMATANDVSHISGFYFTADMLGLESLGQERYGYSSIALQDTVVCKLSIKKLTKKGKTGQAFQQRINELVARKLRDIDSHLYRTRQLYTDQRLLHFLQMVCSKISGSNDYGMNTFELPMAKTDIANYLGMSPESLSRAFRSLERKETLKNFNKRRLFQINTDKATSEVLDVSA